MFVINTSKMYVKYQSYALKPLTILVQTISSWILADGWVSVLDCSCVLLLRLFCVLKIWNGEEWRCVYNVSGCGAWCLINDFGDWLKTDLYFFRQVLGRFNNFRNLNFCFRSYESRSSSVWGMEFFSGEVVLDGLVVGSRSPTTSLLKFLLMWSKLKLVISMRIFSLFSNPIFE